MYGMKDVSMVIMKGIVIVDIPECCEKCDYCYTENNTSLCLQEYNKPVYPEIEDISSRPKWCPIKPVPEKMEEKENAVSIPGVFMEGRVSGWNACIDEILKGERK